MGTVESDIDVNVPISVAYNQWTQFETFPQFMGGVEKVTQLDDTHTHWKVSIASSTRSSPSRSRTTGWPGRASTARRRPASSPRETPNGGR